MRAIAGRVTRWFRDRLMSLTSDASAMHVENETRASPPGVDLQLAVLRYHPTPTLVLSSDKRVVVFANRAARRLLDLCDKKHSTGHEILGCAPADFGIMLLHDLTWGNVLDGLEGSGIAGGVDNHEPMEELEVLITNPASLEKKYMRVLVSTLPGNDSSFYVLAFERASSGRNTSTAEDGISLPNHEWPQPRPGTQPNNGAVHMVDEDAGGRLLRMRRAVFDGFDVPGFVITADGKYYLTNKKVRNIVGNIMGDERGCRGEDLRPRLEMWNGDFTKRLDPKDYPGIRLVRDKKSFTDYLCGFIHEQTKIVMSASGQCLYDEKTEEFLGGVCWCRDMQEYGQFLRNKQERLLSSHETVCDLMPHMVWTTRPDGYVDWYSKRWYQFTGMPPEDCIGHRYQKAIHNEDFEDLMQRWGEGMKTGKEWEVEVRYRRYDGVYRWMLARACPYRDGEGNILKWYGTNTDIHDLVMARIEASRNKAQMLTVLAHAEVNLFAMDTNKKIVMAEGSMNWHTKGNRVDKSDLVGQDVVQAAKNTTQGGVSDFETNINAILSGKVTMAVSEDTIGDRIFRTRVVADLEDDTVDGNQIPAIHGVLGLSIDITDVKARGALELQNAKLMMEEQAAKDSSRMKSQFLANMSHEMRTPTAGVIGMVELLGDDPTLSEEQREFVNSIHLSAKALLTIVNDILDFSKIESGRLDIEEVPFNLGIVVGELCKLLTIFAEQKGLKFIYENDIDEMQVLGDPGRIRQVLSNLLTNALKFTRKGTVTLSVATSRVEDTLDVQFVVRDTGIGIEKNVLDKLFRPFSQGDTSTARLFGGTGLGLTISKNLANLMRGSITLDSIPSVGSTATFNVPLKISSSNVANSEDSISTFGSSPSNARFRLPRGLTSIDTLLIQPSTLRTLSQSSHSTPTPSSQPFVSHTPTSQPAPVDLKAPELSLAEREKIHILVVEDNAINQTIAIKTINKLGFPVTAVWNGKEALSYLLEESVTQPKPDIILMDVQMPVMDGYEATKILRTGDDYNREGKANGDYDGKGKGTLTRRQQRKLKDIPVIAMTASAIQGDEMKCHDAGMDDYLAKPVEKRKLEAMLVKWALGRGVERK